MKLVSPGKESVVELACRKALGIMHLYAIPSAKASFQEYMALFYLKYGLTTGRSTALVSGEIRDMERILRYSEGQARGERLDPLGILCSAVTEIIESLALENIPVEVFICEKVRILVFSLSYSPSTAEASNPFVRRVANRQY